MQRELLNQLYDRFLFPEKGRYVDLGEWSRGQTLDRDLLREAVAELERLKYITVASGVADIAILTAAGVLFVERRLLYEVGAIRKSRDTRRWILAALAAHAQSNGVDEPVEASEICSRAGVTPQEFSVQTGLLGYMPGGLGLIAPVRAETLRATPEIFEELAFLERDAERVARFDALKAGGRLSPQKRGHELEQLLVETIEPTGWRCARNVRAAGQEEDLVLSQGRELYLASCKWESRPASVSHVRDLLSRLDERVGVGGLFFSMSGFSKPARDRAERDLNKHLVLLFGPREIERLIRGEAFFPELLDARYQLAVVHRQLRFE